jgi:type II secretory pathway component PulF
MSLENIDVNDLNRSFIQFQLRISRKQRFRIYRKLEGMLRMNEALSRCLDRLYQNASEMGKYPNRPAAVALREWFLKDRAGVTLSESMDGWVPASELYMIRAGEESGTMAKAFSSIQAMGERAREMKAAVTYAVAYPVFMMILLSFVLWMFGVQLIQNMRKTAPPKVMEAMGGVAAVSDFIANWGIITVVIIVAILTVITLTLPVWRGPIRVKLDRIPPWSWYRVLQGSSFLLGLSALLGAQVPLKRALEILEEQATPWLRERVYSARQEVLRGRNLGEALRFGRYNFPDPSVAVDLEILSERADVGSVIEEVTQDWIRDQIDDLKSQAAVARNIGLVAVGGTIAWSMQSVFNVVTAISGGGGGMSGGMG